MVPDCLKSVEKLVIRNPSYICICIKLIQLHTPPRTTYSHLWLEVKLQSTGLISTTSVQAHLSPAPMILSFKFSPRIPEILHQSPAPPQFYKTTSEKQFNLQGSASPSVILIPNLLQGLPGGWMCKSCLVFVLVQDAEITVTCTSQGFAGETWLRSHLIWKLPNRVRLGKFWVQNWMTKSFPSCGPLYILQCSLLSFPELFLDFYEKLVKCKVTQQSWLNDFI